MFLTTWHPYTAIEYVIEGGSAAPGVVYQAARGQLRWEAHDQSTRLIAVKLQWDNIPHEAELTLVRRCRLTPPSC